MSRVGFTASNGSKQELVSEDECLELWQDQTNNLVYVTLRAEGLRRIAQDYKRRKGVDIEVAEYRSTSSDYYYTSGSSHQTETVVSEISKSLNSLARGASKGLVYLIKNAHGYTMHAFPFLLQMGMDGVARVLDFEKKLADVVCDQFLRIEVGGYQGMQKDHHSCTVFAIDTLKNCLTYERFLSQISTRVHRAEVPKMFLAQGRDLYGSKLNQEKFTKYVDRTSEINRKALYKGHHYAHFLDATHKRFLDRSTRGIVDEIDHKRGKSSLPTTSPALGREMEIYDPQVTFKESAFFNTPRGNKFVAEARHDDKSFKKIFIKNLADAAAEFGMDANQVLQAIQVARIRGGIANASREGGELPHGVTEETLKKFSARVQTLNQFSGIRSSVNENLGLRLCYIPESVTDNAADFAASFNSGFRPRESRSR
jgi:hypothetical protein